MLENSAIGHLTRYELQRLLEICEVDWVFDDSGPECESLIAAIEAELERRRKPAEEMVLLDKDRRVLRWHHDTWEKVIKPLLMHEGIKIREFHDLASA